MSVSECNACGLTAIGVRSEDVIPHSCPNGNQEEMQGCARCRLIFATAYMDFTDIRTLSGENVDWLQPDKDLLTIAWRIGPHTCEMKNCHWANHHDRTHLNLYDGSRQLTRKNAEPVRLTPMRRDHGGSSRCKCGDDGKCKYMPPY